jgi:hypothetical protein
MQLSARYLPPWFGQIWAPLASVCRSNPQQGITSTPVTASHVTQGRVQYESTTPRGTDEGLDVWEAWRGFVPGWSNGMSTGHNGDIYPTFGSNQINAFPAVLSVQWAVCEGTVYITFHRHVVCSLLLGFPMWSLSFAQQSLTMKRSNLLALPGFRFWALRDSMMG